MKKRNFALDFLKFVFAVLIVLFHSNRFSNSVDERIIINGSKGVEFFFIVSGCMLAMSAEKREAGPSLGKDTWQFLKHKFMGLMPNYYIAWIFSFTLFQHSYRIRDRLVRFYQIYSRIIAVPDVRNVMV